MKNRQFLAVGFILSLLLSGGAHADTFSNDLWLTTLGSASDRDLAQAAQDNDVSVLKILLARGFSPNTKYFPLHRAIRECAVDTARILLEAGAKIDALDEQGKKPIDYAMGNTKCIEHYKSIAQSDVAYKLLVEFGAVSTVDKVVTWQNIFDYYLSENRVFLNVANDSPELMVFFRSYGVSLQDTLVISRSVLIPSNAGDSVTVPMYLLEKIAADYAKKPGKDSFRETSSRVSNLVRFAEKFGLLKRELKSANGFTFLHSLVAFSSQIARLHSKNTKENASIRSDVLTLLVDFLIYQNVDITAASKTGVRPVDLAVDADLIERLRPGKN